MVSSPKKGALQGLEKMKLLADLGLYQAILPPRFRPSIAALHALGFNGSDREIFQKAARENRFLLYILSSSAAMWTANSATVSPSSDTEDGRLHITIANQASQFHRSVESDETYRLFTTLFADERLFALHAALPKAANFGDEGAANHTRFCSEYGEKGSTFSCMEKAFSKREENPFSFEANKRGLGSNRTSAWTLPSLPPLCSTKSGSR